MDNFALLGQPRQPWLDPDALKSAFLDHSAREHPDRVHAAGLEEQARATSRYADLNAAYNCLREPKERLAHLLELEEGAPPANVRNIPGAALSHFVQIGQRCQEADRVIAGKAAASSSPLLQVQWFAQGVELTDHLLKLRQQLHLQREELLAELRAMNTTWSSAPPPGSPARPAALPLRRLEEIYRILSYTGRWTAQLQERIAQLAI